MHKVKKYIAEDLKFSNQTIKEMKINSKNFYNNIKERRSIREFSKDKIDINIIKNAILSAGYLIAKAIIFPFLLKSHPFPLVIDFSKFGLFQAWLAQALF